MSSNNGETKNPSQALLRFVEQVKKDVAKATKILWETRTLSASQTFQAYQRVPGEDIYVAVGFPNVWEDGEIKASVAGFDGSTYLGKPQGGAGRYTKIFAAFPHVTTVIHAHTPALGAFASSHTPLTIRYVPVTRETVAKEFPVYVDRRQPEQDFIVERLHENPHLEAVVEANGGSTFWGDGVLHVSRRIVLIEEGAQFQLQAQAFGGSKPYGAGVLEQQWKMGLVPRELAEAALAAARSSNPS
ncbi:MAG: class II aldolase/adducin family protein [Deltaproteobacteria bacterium]|nr:class II aldolase/adducin family protein [Deltaproteobacteria bacterium]